jgi:prepilin-type N-terminal cleavage/methylation domain-containing protein
MSSRSNGRGGGTFAQDSGFTVIEMLIAFTILAIVSGSLFQIFYISAQNNAKAAELDAANSLAITAAELLKTGKNPDESDMFATSSGAVAGGAWRSPDGDRYIKFYDGGWREIELAPVAAGMDLETPAGSHYMMEAELSDSPGMGPELNYVAAALSLSLGSEQDYRLVINERAGEIDAVFNGIPCDIDENKIGGIISVNVEFSQEGAIPKRVEVVNRTGLTVNINVFGVPVVSASATAAGSPPTADPGEAAPGAGSPLPDIESRGGYLEVSPVMGSVSVMYLDDEAHSADSVMRTIVVTVREARSGGSEMAKIEACVYIPG